jgi:hypothetical protein
MSNPYQFTAFYLADESSYSTQFVDVYLSPKLMADAGRIYFADSTGAEFASVDVSSMLSSVNAGYGNYQGTNVSATIWEYTNSWEFLFQGFSTSFVVGNEYQMVIEDNAFLDAPGSTTTFTYTQNGSNGGSIDITSLIAVEYAGAAIQAYFLSTDQLGTHSSGDYAIVFDDQAGHFILMPVEDDGFGDWTATAADDDVFLTSADNATVESFFTTATPLAGAVDEASLFSGSNNNAAIQAYSLTLDQIGTHAAGNYAIVFDDQANNYILMPVEDDGFGDWTATAADDDVFLTSADNATVESFFTTATPLAGAVDEASLTTTPTEAPETGGNTEFAIGYSTDGISVQGHDFVNDLPVYVNLYSNSTTYSAWFDPATDVDTDGFIKLSWEDFGFTASSPFESSFLVKAHQDTNDDGMVDEGEKLAFARIYLDGSTLGGGGMVEAWQPPVLSIEGEVSPGREISVGWSDGSLGASPFMVELIDAQQVRTHLTPFEDGRTFFIPEDAQGLDLEVSSYDGYSMQSVTITETVTPAPSLFGFPSGSELSGSDIGLPLDFFYSSLDDRTVEISSPYYGPSSAGYYEGWSTSNPEFDFLAFTYGANAAGFTDSVSASEAVSAGEVAFKISDGVNPSIFQPAFYNTAQHVFEGQLSHLSVPLSFNGDVGEVTVQLVINDAVFGDAAHLSYTFDHSSPSAYLEELDEASIGGLDAEDAALFAEASLGAKVHSIEFSEPVHFTGVAGVSDIWTVVTDPAQLATSMVFSPSGVIGSSSISGLWLHLVGDHHSEGPIGSGWVSAGSLSTVAGDLRFDQAIIISNDVGADWALRQTTVFDELTGTGTVLDEINGSFTQEITVSGKGYTPPVGSEIELDVSEFGSNLGYASIYFSDVQVNELTGSYSAQVIFSAYSGSGEPLSSQQIAEIQTLVTPQSIKQTVMDATTVFLADDAGNVIDSQRSDPTVYINSTSSQDVLYEPETGSGGADTLDLTALGSGTTVYNDYGLVVSGTKQFVISDFLRLVIDGGSNVVEAGDQRHTIFLEGTGSGNQIAGGDSNADWISYAGIDYTAGNGVTVDLSSTPVTVANDNRDWIAVTRAEGEDYITGIDFFSGSDTADSITGTTGFEILAGAGGIDTVTGNGGEPANVTGGDLLVGGGSGSGIDTLTGSSGVVDVLVDFDGAIMQGRAEVWESGEASDASDHDLFVVRDGSTINNFALSSDQAHLSGRSQYAADRIAFSLNNVALLATALGMTEADITTATRFEITDEVVSAVKTYIKDLNVLTSTSGDDLVLTLTDGTWEVDQNGDPTGNLTPGSTQWGEVTLTGIAATLASDGSGAQVVRLDKYESTAFDAVDYAARELSATEETIAEQVSAEDVVRAFLEGKVLEGQDVLIPIALESVVAGTIGDSTPGKVLASEFGLLDVISREFVPGYGDQDILGGRGSDRYKFVVQDFSEEADGVAGDAGRDTVLDVGGTDGLYLAAATIDNLHMQAFRAGRESDANSLRVNYEQVSLLDDGTSTLQNEGSLTWLGAFREGGRTALEEITVGVDANNDGAIASTEATQTYKVAQADYSVTSWSTHYSDPGVQNATLEAGRSFVVDADASSNWIVVGSAGESDIIRIEGSSAIDLALDSPLEVRVWGFDLLDGFDTEPRMADVIDVADILDANRSHFADSNIDALLNGFATNEAEWAWYSANFADNYVVDAADRSVSIFNDAVLGDNPDTVETVEIDFAVQSELMTIYFMDYFGPTLTEDNVGVVV